MASAPERGQVTIRGEEVHDRESIRSVHLAAFEQAEEADLVDRLRDEAVVIASAVAEIEGRVIGHILFTRMTIETAGASLDAVALAPLAVLPEHQRTGVGGKLVRRGLDRLRALGEAIVIVVGHPDYYPRFGFSAAKAADLQSPFPPDAFMALELRPGALDGVSGRVRYSKPFGL